MDFNDFSENQNQVQHQIIGYDVIINVGDKSFPAHREALMSRMHYFRNMFTADMREKKELTVQFDPLIIHPDIFGDLLGFVYTSKIDFTNENLRPICKAADYFCFDELTNKAKEFMLTTMTIENAVWYRNISVEFYFVSFRDECEEFILHNLSSEAIKSQLPPILSFGELRRFTDKMKKWDKFEDMFNYSIQWILNDEPERTGRLIYLLKNIPLESLSLRFFKYIVSETEIVLKDNACLRLVLDAILAISYPPIEKIYAIGSGTEEEEKQFLSISEYDRKTHEWTVTTPLPCSRGGFGCAVVGHRLYVCGGYNYNGDQNTNSLTVFDTHTWAWTELTPMKHSRQGCAAAVLNEQIYVAGGWMNNDEVTPVVERYCVSTDRWEEIASMTTKRVGLELVALNGFLYAIGGDGGNGYLNSVERYDTLTDQWTQMSHTNHEYFSFGSAVLYGTIYIAGTSTCEMYSPTEDKWTEMPAPKECFDGRRLAVYDGRLYSIGGNGIDWEGDKTVEWFAFGSSWARERNMGFVRFNHGVAMVKI